MSFVHGAEHAASAAMIGCRQPNHSFISISPTPCHAFSHSRTVLEPPLHVRQWETVRNTKSTTPRVPCCQSQASGSMHTLCTERGELLALVPVSGIQDNAVKVLSSPCSFILITHICTNFIHVQGIVPMPVTGYRIHIHIISVSVTRQQPHTSKPVRLFLTAMFPSIGRLFLLLLPACSVATARPGRSDSGLGGGNKSCVVTFAVLGLDVMRGPGESERLNAPEEGRCSPPMRPRLADSPFCADVGV